MFIAFRLPENITSGRGAEIARGDTLAAAMAAASDTFAAIGWQLLLGEIDADNPDCADMMFAKPGTAMMAQILVEPESRGSRAA